jgi:hypothetical protein
MTRLCPNSPDYSHGVVYPGGSYCNVSDNTFRDGVYLISDDMYFAAADSSFSTAKGNFLSAVFAPGMPIYLGSSRERFF